MENKQFLHNGTVPTPNLSIGLEEELLASQLVSEIRKSPGHYSFTMTDTGMMALIKAMHSSALEEALEVRKEPTQVLFPEQSEELISKKDAMKGFNVSHTTLWKWKKSGYLTPVKVGKKVYYKRADIEKLTK